MLIIEEAEVETNFACKVAYLKLRNDMAKMEQDQLYFDTNFDQHMKMYESFRQLEFSSILADRGLSLTAWEQIISTNSDIKDMFNEKVLFPFVGIVKEQSNTIGETAYLQQPRQLMTRF